MEKITIGKDEIEYLIKEIVPYNINVIRIIFSDTVPEKYGDINLYTESGVFETTLSGYSTVWRDEGQTVYLSNDESIYTAPMEQEYGGILGEVYQPTLEELRSAKLIMINSSCNMAITAGCDVILTDGTTEHYSLSETDQINLSAAVSSVQAGAVAYPYHADGELCKMYSADDIILIGSAATIHKLYHTTYCNHLHAWIKRVYTADELETINYGAELPEDLATNMSAILAAVSGVSR